MRKPDSIPCGPSLARTGTWRADTLRGEWRYVDLGTHTAQCMNGNNVCAGAHGNSVTRSCLVWWASLTSSRRHGHERPMAGQTRPSHLSIRLSSSAFHENRPRALRALTFAHNAKTLGNFSIGLKQATEIAAEAVLVELVVGFDVPEPAGLHLEVNEANSNSEK